MTSVGDLLVRSRTDPLAAAARHLNRVDAGLRDNRIAVVGPDFGGLATIQIGEVLHHGWSQYQALHEAGRATLAAPGTVRHVSLHHLTLAFRYDPSIQVYLGATPILRIPFGAAIIIDLVEFLGTVTAGRLVGAAARAMNAHLEITVERKVFSSDPVALVPEHEIWLGQGIPLVHGA